MSPSKATVEEQLRGFIEHQGGSRAEGLKDHGIDAELEVIHQRADVVLINALQLLYDHYEALELNTERKAATPYPEVYQGAVKMLKKEFEQKRAEVKAAAAPGESPAKINEVLTKGVCYFKAYPFMRPEYLSRPPRLIAGIPEQVPGVVEWKMRARVQLSQRSRRS